MSAFLALLVTKNVNFMKMRNLRFENEEALSENALSLESIISKPTFSRMSLRMRSKFPFCRHMNDKAWALAQVIVGIEGTLSHVESSRAQNQPLRFFDC